MAPEEQTTSVPFRLDYEAHAPDAYKALADPDHTVVKELDRVGFAEHYNEDEIAALSEFDRDDQRVERDRRQHPRLGAGQLRALTRSTLSP